MNNKILIHKLKEKNIITKKGNINNNSFRNKNNISLYNKIIHKTLFLNSSDTSNTLNNSDVKISERIYCIYYNIHKKPICKNPKCKNYIKFISFNEGYRSFCSPKCKGQDPDIKNKTKQTNISKYGFSCSLLNPQIQQKTKNTNLKKYGTEYGQASITAKLKREKTNIIKFGTKNPFLNKSIQNKIKSTNKKLFGYENVFQNKIIQTKIKITNIIKYGFKSPSKNNTIKNNTINTNILKYGTNFPMQNPQIQQKTKNTNLEKYGNEYISQNKYIINKGKLKKKLKKIQKRKDFYYSKYTKPISKDFNFNISKDEFASKGVYGPYSLQCKKCLNIVPDSFIYNYKSKRFARCFSCNPISRSNGYSNTEKDVLHYIQSFYKGTIIQNDRQILQGKELDILLPEIGLAIEFNGLMFHSIGKSSSSMFNNSDYEFEIKNKHLRKTEECNKQGIQLLHIFENERIDNMKQNIWKSIIKSTISEKYYLLKNK